MKKVIDSFKTKGLIDLGNSMWVTTEPCIINNCELKPGILIIDASVCKFKDDVYNTKTGDLILVQGATTSFYKYGILCAGELLPADNKLRPCDTLDEVGFNPTGCVFDGGSTFVNLAKGKGKDDLYTFDVCYSTVNLLTDENKLLNFLNTDTYNELSDVSSFGYTETDKYGNNHDTKYTPVDGIKGLYFKCDRISYNDRTHTDFGLEWLTKDDVNRCNRASTYGIIISNDSNDTYKLSDPVLDALKVINDVHERNFITKGADYDTGINVGDFNVSIDSFKNIYDTMLNANNDTLHKCNYIRDSYEFNEDAGEDYYSRSVSFNIYFNKDTLPCGL